MDIKEVTLDDNIEKQLIELSKKWVEEDITNGYITNERSDLEDKRIFICESDNQIIGYILGHQGKAERFNMNIINGEEDVFEIDEIYVLEEYRSRGIGKKLFEYMQDHCDIKNIVLATATKDYQRILKFYIDDLGMEFHSALLYKK